MLFLEVDKKARLQTDWSEWFGNIWRPFCGGFAQVENLLGFFSLAPNPGKRNKNAVWGVVLSHAKSRNFLRRKINFSETPSHKEAQSSLVIYFFGLISKLGRNYNYVSNESSLLLFMHLGRIRTANFKSEIAMISIFSHETNWRIMYGYCLQRGKFLFKKVVMQ